MLNFVNTLNKFSGNRMVDSIAICPLSYKLKSHFYLTYTYFQNLILKDHHFNLLIVLYLFILWLNDSPSLSEIFLHNTVFNKRH